MTASLPTQLRAIAARAIPNGTTAETHSPVHTIHCLDVHMQAIEAAACAIERLTTYAAGIEAERDALQEKYEAALADSARLMDKVLGMHASCNAHKDRARAAERDALRPTPTLRLPADDTEGGDPS